MESGGADAFPTLKSVPAGEDEEAEDVAVALLMTPICLHLESHTSLDSLPPLHAGRPGYRPRWQEKLVGSRSAAQQARPSIRAFKGKPSRARQVPSAGKETSEMASLFSESPASPPPREEKEEKEEEQNTRAHFASFRDGCDYGSRRGSPPCKLFERPGIRFLWTSRTIEKIEESCLRQSLAGNLIMEILGEDQDKKANKLAEKLSEIFGERVCRLPAREVRQAAPAEAG